MQRLALFFGALALMLAGAGSYLVANLIANYIETSTKNAANLVLSEEGLDWITLRVDGISVSVSGAAPTESARFKALIALKRVINADQIVDSIAVVEPDDLHPPKFSLELLRNGDGISLIGLIPETTGSASILGAIEGIDGKTDVTDMLETTDFPAPEGWSEAVDFALASLRSLPRSKISVAPGQVTITAISNSRAEKARIETELEDARPDGVALVSNISAPRPVITPFSLRLIKDDLGTRFDSCSADTAAARDRILAAARKAGMADTTDCTIGLGAPTPHWADAVDLAIAALNELGGGSVTFSDADISIVAPDSLGQNQFDLIIHNLEQALPEVFSVHAILPPKPALEGTAVKSEAFEFLVTKSPEGLVQMRGRSRDERTKTAINNFAKALFGSENVHDTTRIDSAIPDGWPVRVLTGIEALSKLHHGSLLVTQTMLELRGTADKEEAKTEVTQLLSDKLGENSYYQMFVNYEEALNKAALLPSPEECVVRINTILAEKQIDFAPSSTRIEGEAVEIVDKIAAAMTDCDEVAMEIGGHTDSQGRETMNLTLSQARAEAVLDALLRREILTTYLTAKGYGEIRPIADNKTEVGRKANRRIEFTLIVNDDPSDTGGEPETDAPATATEGADTQTETAPKTTTKESDKNGQD